MKKVFKIILLLLFVVTYSSCEDSIEDELIVESIADDVTDDTDDATEDDDTEDEDDDTVVYKVFGEDVSEVRFAKDDKDVIMILLYDEEGDYIPDAEVQYDKDSNYNFNCDVSFSEDIVIPINRDWKNIETFKLSNKNIRLDGNCENDNSGISLERITFGNAQNQPAGTFTIAYLPNVDIINQDYEQINIFECDD